MILYLYENTFKLMKFIYLFVIASLLSCFSETESDEFVQSSTSPMVENSDLSLVIEKLQNEKVDGYVLIHYQSNEYSSIEKARADVSASKAIVQLDTEQANLHMPLSHEDTSKYNWGSPLVFREVIQDFGDVVAVLTQMWIWPNH